MDICRVIGCFRKGCRKRPQVTKDHLLVDKAVFREARVKKRCWRWGG